ncbi:MAG: hypothetical protein WCE23_13890 [Candidatus Binatus sp.]
MMLDAAHRDRTLADPQRARRFRADRRKARLRAQPVARGRRHLKRVPRLAHDSRPRIARDGNDVDVARRRACRRHHVLQGLDRKACRVLDAVEALLFRGCDQPAVNDCGCARIAVICVDSYN